MSAKRSAFEAFGKSTGQLSAFAAVKQAKLPTRSNIDIGDLNQDQQLEPLIDRVTFDSYDERGISENLSTGVDNVAVSTVPSASFVKLSTFVASPRNVLHDDESALELLLRTDDALTIIGIYDVQVLTGIATVYGTLLHPDLGPQRVYAPSIQALPQLVSRNDNTTIRVLSVKSEIRRLGRLSPAFRNIWATDDAKGRSFAVLSSSEDDVLQRSLSLLEVDDGCRKALSRINSMHEEVDGSQPIIMAIGSKSAGKSTFNRLLCNMIHSRWSTESCLYLDLDPGQPEFGLPGQMSLVEVKAPILGPPFSHPAERSSTSYRLIRSHAIAALSFKDEPEHYLACSINLYRHARSNKSTCSLPMIINSCGWVSGLGGNTIFQIAREFKITDIVQLGSVGEGLTESLAALGCNIHPVPRRAARPFTRAPAELRAMQAMAYFHSKPLLSTALPVWTGKPLTSLRPWEVSYRQESHGIHAILSYGQHPSQEFLAEVLDGSIVALVQVSSDLLDTARVARTSAEDLPYLQPEEYGISSPLDPRQSQCISLALVRGIDVVTKKLLLITPLMESEITEMTQAGKVVLVRGGFDSPDWAYLEDLYAGKKVIESVTGSAELRPWVTKKERVGVEGAVWRLRHPPLASAMHK